MKYVIETYDITKRYGDIVAVDRLSLRVEKGEIYAFLGLNGAGKTTTIRMILGMVRPTAGTIKVLGRSVNTEGHGPWSSVGFVVDTPHSYPELTVRENLEIFRRLRMKDDRKVVDQVVERLGLGAYLNHRAQTLSLGNQQRLGLAKALLHKPELLVLDEPINGLDPSGIAKTRDLLRELVQKEGITVFMSSHILAEVSKLATQVGIIHEGRMLLELRADELEHRRHSGLRLSARDRKSALFTLAGAGYAADVASDGTLEVRDRFAMAHPDDIARLLVDAGNPPTLLKVEEEDLESYFLRLVGKNGGSEQQ